MTKLEKKKMVVAMETVMRHLNDERIFEGWLMCGVADGDVTKEVVENPNLLDDYYCDDFDDICEEFVRLVERARKQQRPFY